MSKVKSITVEINGDEITMPYDEAMRLMSDLQAALDRRPAK